MTVHEGQRAEVTVGVPSGEATHQLGCVSCQHAVRVIVDGPGLAELTVLAGEEVPLTELPARGSHPSPCGMAAVNGTCRNEETIALIRDFVGTGELPGVQLAEG